MATPRKSRKPKMSDPSKPFTVRTPNSQELVHVGRAEGVELVAGKQAKWDPPLPAQLAAQEETAAPSPAGA
jgi:hypothetical protein